nr:hypothetical protein [uncultured Desulfuromonas sp.]
MEPVISYQVWHKIILMQRVEFDCFSPAFHPRRHENPQKAMKGWSAQKIRLQADMQFSEDGFQKQA